MNYEDFLKNKIIKGDAFSKLSSMPDGIIDCCVTSPPYWNLRDYGVDGQLGQESTPEEYVDNMVKVFREVRRVLKSDGTLWLNIGDSHASSDKKRTKEQAVKNTGLKGSTASQEQILHQNSKIVSGLKPKDLVGIPWMLAFALRADGWYLRSDIIWAKKNCMPESVTDRPTRSHEYIFLLSKSKKYYYDHNAIKEPAIYDVNGAHTAARKARVNASTKVHPTESNNGIRADKERGHSRRHAGFNDRWDNMTKEEQCTGMRNKRDVWTIAPAQFPEAHFATFPEELIVDCVKAGCPPDGIVLDPFMGAGTTGVVARKLGRDYLGIELNQEYIDIATKRIHTCEGIFASNNVESAIQMSILDCIDKMGGAA